MTGSARTMTLFESWVGRTLDEVDTPVAVVDLDRLDANIQRLQEYANRHGIALWPHAKTHKCVDIGLHQIRTGASGLTVAKSGEAEVFCDAGVDRLLVHYPTFGTAKWKRLARLAANGLDLTVALDGIEVGEGLSAALTSAGARADVLIEVDLGMRRTGVSPDQAPKLAQRLDALPGLSVVGVSGYPGDRRTGGSLERYVQHIADLLDEARDGLEAASIPCDRISGGSTPSRYLTHKTSVSELRAGTYVFLDRTEAGTEPDGGIDACALTVLASVVSTAVPGGAIIDAGSKSLTNDPHPDGRFGEVTGTGASLVALNEEHGYLDLEDCPQTPRVGDRVRVIPNHACGCVNLQDALLGARGDVIERVFPVAARGLTW